MNSQSSDQPKNEVKTLFFFSPLPFPCKFCKCNSSGIFTALQFLVLLPLIYTVWPNAYSEVSLEVAAATFRDFLRKRLWRAFTLANQLGWTAQYPTSLSPYRIYKKNRKKVAIYWSYINRQRWLWKTGQQQPKSIHKACRACIGWFSEAGLHEWMPFVIFHAKSCNRSQHPLRANFWVGIASCCV